MDLDGPHWRFSLAVYGQPGVPEACLALQDTLNLDVNVLLLMLHEAAQGRIVAAQRIEMADRAIAEWRSDIVVALRSIRRRLKDGPAGAPREAAEALRSTVKRAELAAEQIEQAWLAGFLAQHGAGDPVPATAEALREAARCVARFYAAAAGEVLDDAALAHADHVAAAAADIALR
jgi:uncharacterized protein (TIGR02444 family)